MNQIKPAKKFDPVPKSAINDSILQEIYLLRVLAWENSDYRRYINRSKFPDGLSDKLDNSGSHWYITDNENAVVASCRINICNGLSEIPGEYGSLEKFDIPKKRPFAFFSRLAVRKDYQGMQLASLLTDRCIKSLNDSSAYFGLTFFIDAYCDFLTKRGFLDLGEISLGETANSIQSHLLIIHKRSLKTS